MSEETPTATFEREERVNGEATVPLSVYESAVKGRQDFRKAYRELLPVLRAAEKLSRLWRTSGQRVDVTEFWDAINEIDVAVCGGHAKPEYISEREGRLPEEAAEHD